MRRLIINADDFGMTSGVNRAILDAHRSGTVTSATIMANELATDEAIALANASPSLATGCHVVLVDGRPLSNLDRVRSLIGSHNGTGAHFRPGVAHLAMAAVSGRIRSNEVQNEAGEQIARLRSRGVAPSHVDCHMHSHILPVILRAVLQASRENGVMAIRSPFEPAWAVAATHKPSSLRSWNRSAQVTVLRSLQSQFIDAVTKSGMKTTDGSIGIAVTGLLNRELFTSLVDAMPHGTWELVTHPGYNDRDLASASTELKKSREIELDLLTAAETLELIRLRGIELINYRDL
jgi:predicted glycoside hydrolase/deacetylase ChbG (UPF0249 family)